MMDDKKLDQVLADLLHERDMCLADGFAKALSKLSPASTVHNLKTWLVSFDYLTDEKGREVIILLFIDDSACVAIQRIPGEQAMATHTFRNSLELWEASDRLGIRVLLESYVEQLKNEEAGIKPN